MTTIEKRFVREPAKVVPVIHNVDVAVAGCGLSGTFAALASARQGANTAIVERFGVVGGHLGPGTILAAGLTEFGPERTLVWLLTTTCP